MPSPTTPEEVLEQFDNIKPEKLSQEKKAQLRPQLEALLNEQDPGRFSAGMTDFLLQDDAGSDLGVVGCQATMLRDDSQTIAKEVGCSLLRQEMMDATSAGTFLRSDHAVNGFSKEFMAQNGGSFAEQIKERMREAGQRLNVSGLNGADKEVARNHAALELANELIDVATTAEIDPPAKEYLEALYSTATNAQDQQLQNHLTDIGTTGQALGQTVATNNLMLRLGSDAALDAMGKIHKTSKMATEAAQKVFNGFDRPAMETMDGGVNKAAYTPENRAKVQGVQERLGGKPVMNGMDQRFTVDLNNPELARATAKVEQIGAKIDKLRNNPSFMDKVKALRHGGVKGEIAHLEKKIQVAREIETREMKFESVGQQKSDLEAKREHHEKKGEKIAELNQAQAKLKEVEKAANLGDSLAKSGLVNKPRSTAESEALAKAANKAINELEDTKSQVLGDMSDLTTEGRAKKEVDFRQGHEVTAKEIKRDEKAISVREKMLGEKAPTHNAPSQGKGHHV